jgi:hypothetical protein
MARALKRLTPVSIAALKSPAVMAMAATFI